MVKSWQHTHQQSNHGEGWAALHKGCSIARRSALAGGRRSLCTYLVAPLPKTKTKTKNHCKFAEDLGIGSKNKLYGGKPGRPSAFQNLSLTQHQA